MLAHYARFSLPRMMKGGAAVLLALTLCAGCGAGAKSLCRGAGGIDGRLILRGGGSWEGAVGGSGGGEGGFRTHAPGEEEGEAETVRLRSPVVRVPRDFTRLEEAVEHAMQGPRSAFKGVSTVVSIASGSHLMPRRYKTVIRSKDCWQYWQSHPADWQDGKMTVARIPDDGCEPQLSVNYPCEYLPTRGTRFFNVTQPAQFVGDGCGGGGEATRVCGAWHLALPDFTSGSFKDLALLNQEECVILVNGGGWRIEECLLMASGVGGLGADVVFVGGRSHVVMFRCSLQPIRRGEPGEEWAAWPPGAPANGGGFLGKTSVPAVLNPAPQDGFAMVGLMAQGRSKVMVDECRFRGMVLGATAADSAEVTIDGSAFQWNQYGTAVMHHARLVLRTCRFEDNVFGAAMLWEEKDAADVVLELNECAVRGPLWASELRPESLVEVDNDVADSPAAFREGAGRHGAEGFFPEYAPTKAGEWVHDWSTATGFAGVPDGKGSWKPGVDVASHLCKQPSRTAAAQTAGGDAWAQPFGEPNEFDRGVPGGLG